MSRRHRAGEVHPVIDLFLDIRKDAKLPDDGSWFFTPGTPDGQAWLYDNVSDYLLNNLDFDSVVDIVYSATEDGLILAFGGPSSSSAISFAEHNGVSGFDVTLWEYWYDRMGIPQGEQLTRDARRHRAETPSVDISIWGQGMYTIYGETSDGDYWLLQNVNAESQPDGSYLTDDQGYAEDIAAGALDAGLRVSINDREATLDEDGTVIFVQ